MKCYWVVGWSLLIATAAWAAEGDQGEAADANLAAPTDRAADAPPRDAIAAAEAFVKASDRYLHQDRLARGMRGRGRTVLEGIEIVSFDVEILSVMRNYYPGQDVILARLRGRGLETTGVIEGMSGSPVYVKDSDDGRERLIGAVAYGWTFPREAICGIQPIAHMLAVGDVYRSLGGAAGEDGPDDKPADEPGDADEAGAKVSTSAGAGAAWPAGRRKAFLAALLAQRKGGEPRGFAAPRVRRDRPEGEDSPRLRRPAVPMMVSGVGAARLEVLRRRFGRLGLRPVQAGGAAAADRQVAAKVPLEAGASLAVSVVSGDAEWTAIGTVTEVVGERVLAFGHGMFGQGDLELPMGPSMVHTVVPSRYSSFKLGSALRMTGALSRDEYVGVTGRIGLAARQIPMRVEVDFRPDRRRRTFGYRLCRHDNLTPMLPAALVGSSVLDLRDLPIEHTVRYEMEMDYGDLGRYHGANVSSGWGLLDALWELEGVLGAMAYNPFAKPRLPEAVRVRVTVRAGSRDAAIEALTLDAPVYRPGETVTGTLRIRPFRKERTSRRVRFALPDDLPEGPYTLEACDGYAASIRLRQEQPHRFDPETQRELFAVLRRVAVPRLDRLYLRLPLPDAGLAIGEQELPALPASRAALLHAANVPDVKPYRRALVRSRESDYVLSGSASASFEVRRRPEGIRLTGPAQGGEE